MVVKSLGGRARLLLMNVCAGKGGERVPELQKDTSWCKPFCIYFIHSCGCLSSHSLRLVPT